jgi:hypothetical protein
MEWVELRVRHNMMGRKERVETQKRAYREPETGNSYNFPKLKATRAVAHKFYTFFPNCQQKVKIIASRIGVCVVE